MPRRCETEASSHWTLRGIDGVMDRRTRGRARLPRCAITQARKTGWKSAAEAATIGCQVRYPAMIKARRAAAAKGCASAHGREMPAAFRDAQSEHSTHRQRRNLLEKKLNGRGISDSM